jgi:hypothetical protein
MTGAPYSTVFSPNNPTFLDWPLTSFLASSGTVPTASSGYAKYTVIGNLVILQFKYVFATVGTGNYRLNLPIAISSSYNKPQGQFFVRYVSGADKVHPGLFNENTSTLVNMVASTTYGSAPANFTSSSPNAGLASGDIVHGEIRYIID